MVVYTNVAFLANAPVLPKRANQGHDNGGRSGIYNSRQSTSSKHVREDQQEGQD